MPKLYRNEEGEYYTRCQMNGTFSTFHFSDGIKPYLTRNHISIGDELPHSWYRDTSRWRHTHGMPHTQSAQSGLVNSTCPICKRPVFYYTNEYGSKVYFDHAGDTWPKHPCMISKASLIQKGNLVRIDTPKITSGNTYTFFLTKNLSFETSKFFTHDKKENCHFFLHEIDNEFKTLVIITPSHTRELKIKNLVTIHQNTKTQKTKKIQTNTKNLPSQNEKKIPPPTSSFPVDGRQQIEISSIRFDKNLIYIDIKNNPIYRIATKFKKFTIDITSKFIIIFKNGTVKSVQIKNGNDIEEYNVEKFYHNIKNS